MIKRVAIGFVLALSALHSAALADGLPGKIKTRTSKYDQAVELSMEPAWVGSMSPLKMGLFWRSSMPENDLLLTVVVKGAHSFGDGEPLHFKVDGEFHHFSAVDVVTDIKATEGFYAPGFPVISGSNWSSKRFVVTREFVDSILKAKSVVVRVDLATEYVEAVFSKDGPTTARPAFRKFVAKLTGEKSKQ